jgi:hypothetical protein
VPDRTLELLALLDDASAERFARRLLWAVLLRRIAVVAGPLTVVLLRVLG